jgi:hypothetical protein
MERKLGRTAVIAGGAKVPSNAAALSGSEENVLRMLKGATVDPHAPLARAAPPSSDIGQELLLLEMQLFREHQRKAQGGGRPVPSRPAADVRAKSKIIRGLRKKR